MDDDIARWQELLQTAWDWTSWILVPMSLYFAIIYGANYAWGFLHYAFPT